VSARRHDPSPSSASTPQDDALAADCTRLVRQGSDFVLQVALVEWPHPAEPVARWIRFQRWRQSPDDRQVAAARSKALRNRRFFAICHECGERHNRGHMFEGTVCQGCAASCGVVY
jgi:hypothetical protein